MFLLIFIGRSNHKSLFSSLSAPRVDFVQEDFDSLLAWDGVEFCRDRELYVDDANGDKK